MSFIDDPSFPLIQQSVGGPTLFPSSVIVLSSNEVASDAEIGTVVGTLSITAVVEGTPVWSLIDDANGRFAVNASTGVVTVAAALSANATYSIKVKVRGTIPEIICPLFSLLTDGDEGGGAPEWVPENSKIHIDLVGGSPQGRAWVDGIGAVAVDTLLGSDPNTESSWGATGYDAGALTADGYVCHDNPAGSRPIAIIGAARTKFFTGCTFCFGVKKAEADNSPYFAILSADGNDALEVDFNASRSVDAYSSEGDLDLEIPNITNIGVGAIDVLAVTYTATRFEIAANGGGPDSAILTETETPPGNPLVAIIIDGTTDAIQYITVYDPLPSTIGLSVLSQTGVANTAPHDLTWTNQNTNINGAVFTATSLTVSEASSTFDFAWDAETFIGVGDLSSVDDEGNPIAYSLEDDAGGKFGFQNGGFGFVQKPQASDGTYTIKVRATDPGGLYAEQIFTITVTA